MSSNYRQSSSQSLGVWSLAWRRLCADQAAMVALSVLVLMAMLLSASSLGVIAPDWEETIAVSYAPPDFLMAQENRRWEQAVTTAQGDNPFDPLRKLVRELVAARAAAKPAAATSGRLTSLPLGADKWGHDVLKKTIKGAETSVMVGVSAAFLATCLGLILGAMAGYFGRWVDDGLNWLYSVLTSIPYLLLVMSVAAVLQTRGLTTIICILAFTGWTAPYRLIRAEYMKHKAREYVMAADVMGASHARKMFIHILPNVTHVALVQMSILVVSFIKSEVILSFLGFGVPVGVVSWGSMLNEAQNELIQGKWWQLAAASVSMAILITAFSFFTDALRDALDPKI